MARRPMAGRSRRRPARARAALAASAVAALLVAAPAPSQAQGQSGVLGGPVPPAPLGYVPPTSPWERFAHGGAGWTFRDPRFGGPFGGWSGARFGPTWAGGDLASSGIVDGVVSAVDHERGLVRISSGGGLGRSLVVNARPFALLGVAPGEVVSLSVRNLGGALWADDGGVGAAAASPGRFGLTGTLSGTVQGVDLRRGVVRVGDAVLRAHPDDVSALAPGGFARVRYAVVGSVPWVVDAGW